MGASLAVCERVGTEVGGMKEPLEFDDLLLEVEVHGVVGVGEKGIGVKWLTLP